jgi:pectate lyase
VVFDAATWDGTATKRLGSIRVLVWGLLVLVLSPASLAAEPGRYLKNSDSWFAGQEAREIAASVLSFQSELGGWPKNVSTTTGSYQGDRSALRPTYDNGATTDELRFLARIHGATGDEEYRRAFTRGLDYVLAGQYPNGGWPQFHPPGNQYHRHVTFNDDAMVRLLRFTREVATDRLYAFVEDARRRDAARAFRRGIDCILRCQIRVDGRLTAWCAQHDEIDFHPRPGRSYELATLSGCESVGITRLLMSLEHPTPEVVRAVEAAVAWFDDAKLSGIRVESVEDPRGPKGRNRVVVQDPTAPPLWARFYAIDTNQPVFADRDGIPRQRLDQIGYERRNGYAWYGTWPRKLLEAEYPVWRERVASDSARP